MHSTEVHDKLKDKPNWSAILGYSILWSCGWQWHNRDRILHVTGAQYTFIKSMFTSEAFLWSWYLFGIVTFFSIIVSNHFYYKRVLECGPWSLTHVILPVPWTLEAQKWASNLFIWLTLWHHSPLLKKVRTRIQTEQEPEDGS